MFVLYSYYISCISNTVIVYIIQLLSWLYIKQFTAIILTTWTQQCWITSKNLYTSSLCGGSLEDLSEIMVNSDGWQERIRELCYQHDLISMISPVYHSYYLYHTAIILNVYSCYCSYYTAIISLAWWVECLLMVQETGVQSQVKPYQRLKKMVLDAALLSTQHYKVRIKGKVEQSREWSSGLPYTLV